MKLDNIFHVKHISTLNYAQFKSRVPTKNIEKKSVFFFSSSCFSLIYIPLLGSQDQRAWGAVSPQAWCNGNFRNSIELLSSFVQVSLQFCLLLLYASESLKIGKITVYQALEKKKNLHVS